MKRPGLTLTLAAIICFIVSWGCSAQAPEANLKIPPPASAVERDVEAWRELTLSAGGFAVLVPGKPEEKSASMETAAGQVKIHVAPVLTEVASYVVAYAEFPAAVSDPEAVQKVLDGAVSRVVGMDRNKLLSESKISLDGVPGRRFEVDVPHLNCVVNGKAFFGDRRLYTLIITTRKYRAAPKETVTFYESAISKFLDSFRFTDEIKPARTLTPTPSGPHTVARTP